ncbi:MAG: radical SAM protein [Thermoplasmata archaeon]|nr:MAG: radical SAM protein [Thermoplasmata archaeon]
MILIDLQRFLGLFTKPEAATCTSCGTTAPTISKALGVCRSCILEGSAGALNTVAANRRKHRGRFSLPSEIPRQEHAQKGDVRKCKGCVNACEIVEGGNGFCGLRAVRSGRLEMLAGTPRGAMVEWYFDPLPTNCVADFVCPGGTGAGYPTYSHTKGTPEHGHSNMAVFYEACTFDCTFCQNWHFRKVQPEEGKLHTSADLARAALTNNTSCICYFGGDPTPQITHSLKAGRLARELKGEDEIMRICWESNGSMPRSLARAIGELALESGGCIKFDLKVKDQNLHQALCGTSNKNTFYNFKMLWDRFGTERPEPPILIASTLLVPGYVGAHEVREISEFLAELDTSIPYALLAFHPDFNMPDMGTTTRKSAMECKQAAQDAGLSRVKIGNLHLLA